MIFLLAGIALIVTGGLVSIAFWIPGLIDRQNLRELLGSRYPLIYVVYSANGPVLLFAGILLVLKYYSVF
jgi:hypothetical protein